MFTLILAAVLKHGGHFECLLDQLVCLNKWTKTEAYDNVGACITKRTIFNLSAPLSYGFRCTAAMPMKMLWLASVLLCFSWSSQMSLMEHTRDTLQAINSLLLSMETYIENRQQSTESRLESIESRVFNGECSGHELYVGQIKRYELVPCFTVVCIVLSKSLLTPVSIAISPTLFKTKGLITQTSMFWSCIPMFGSYIIMAIFKLS